MLHRLAPQLEDTRTRIHYFSHLRKRPIVDAAGKPVGILIDLLATAPSRGQQRMGEIAGHSYLPPPAPLLLGLLVAAADRQFLLVQPTQIASGYGKQIHLQCPRETLAVYVSQPNAVRLATTVLNRDVIDLVKKRVVLVNDLALDEDWRLLGLDGSSFGLLHWLLPHGVWEHVIPPATRAFLPWGHVALLPEDTVEGEGEPGRYSSATQWPLRHFSTTELADLLQQLTPKEGSRILATLDATKAAATLTEFAPPDQVLLFKQTERSSALRVLEAMEPGMAADLVAALPTHEVQHVLEQIRAARATELQRLLAYPHASAGRLMTTHALLLDPEGTIAAAVGKMRRMLLEGHRIVEMAYVVDTPVEDDPPVVGGAVPIGKLLAADPADLVQDLVQTPLVSVRPETDLHTVAELMHSSRLQALPVLDAEGRLLGVIQMADVLDRLLGMPQRRLHHLSPRARTIW